MKTISIKKEFLWEKIIFVALAVFIFLTMYYYDNQLTFVYVIENMHRIVSGQWYYIFNGWTATPYGLILQGACAIWSIPVFLLSELGVISVTCVGARLWYKLFVLTFLLLDTWQLGVIARLIGINSEKKITWIRLFFVSSLIVALPALHIAQMDAVYLFPMLLGIAYYLQNDYKKFLVSFAIAIPIKFIPLFVFIPLVLLKQKKYMYILRDLCIGCIGIVFDKVMKSIGYRIETYLGIDPSLEVPDVSSSVMELSLGNLLESNIMAFEVGVSIALMLFFILCVWCYLKREEHFKKLAIYVSFSGLLCLFAFGTVAPYWALLLVPFVLLLIFKNDNLYRLLLPLELAFSCGYIYIFIFRTKWIYGSADTFDFLIFTMIPGYLEQIHGFVADFLEQRNLEGFSGVMSAMMTVCMGSILALTNPLKKVEAEEDKNPEMYLRGWYWVHIFVLLAWLGLNILVVACNRVSV